MARKKLDPHDINRVKPENPASLRSDCPACSGMPVQLGVESVSSFTGIRNSVIWPKMPFHFWIRNGPDDVFTTLPDRLKSAWKPCCTRSSVFAQYGLDFVETCKVGYFNAFACSGLGGMSKEIAVPAFATTTTGFPLIFGPLKTAYQSSGIWFFIF
jgi:hypothetical protein